MPFVDSHLDPADLSDLSDESSDGGAKGKVVESLGCEISPELEAGACCPKKPRTTVRKRKASVDAM